MTSDHDGASLVDDINPFDGYGKIVGGDRLIGRGDLVDRIASSLELCNGSVALIGLPRIGKSSVAREVLHRFDDGGEDAPLSMWIDVGTLGGVDLFRAMYEELRDWDDDIPALAGDADSFVIYSDLKRQCRKLRKRGRHVIAILDEFDAITRGDEPDLTIRRLRELVYEPDYNGVCATFVARRPLHWIERVIPDLSTLSGVCRSEYVRPLGREEWSDILARGGDRCRARTDEATLWSMTGGHPFLTEMVLHGVWSGSTLDDAFAERHSDIETYYELVVEIIERDGQVDLSESLRTQEFSGQLDHLRALGVIRSDGNDVWSEGFRTFVEERSGRVGTNAVWSTDPD